MGFDPDAYLAKKPAAQFDPDAYLKAPSKNDAPSWGDALLSAPGAALGEVGDAITGTGKFLASLPDDPLGYRIGRGLKALPGAVANDLGGMMQYARNLSPPEQRGSAPEMPGGEAENHPFLALGTGDTGPMRQNVAQHPLALALDAAGVAGMTAPGRRALGVMADAAKAPVRGVARAIADMSPANRAENQLLSAARQTSTPDAIAEALAAHRPRVEGVPMTAAQATQDPGITGLERVSRGQNAPSWTQFDNGQNTALYNALHSVVNPATDDAVQTARDARDVATRHDRQAALALANQGSLEPEALHSGLPFPSVDESIPDVHETIGSYGERVLEFPHPDLKKVGLVRALSDAGQHSIEPFAFQDRGSAFAVPAREAIANELSGPRGVLPSVQTTGKWAQASIPEQGATANRAYEVRKKLADALNAKAGINPSELDASIKSANVSSGAIKTAIDTSLNKASGGMWQQYLDAFAAQSPTVKNMEALNEVRDALARKVDLGLQKGDAPNLTRAWLGQTLDPNAADKFGKFIYTQPTREALGDILATAQDIEAPNATLRAGATGGGGSDTTSRVIAHAVNHFGGGTIARIGQIVSGVGENRARELLTEALQNPRVAAQALRNASERDATRNAARSSGRVPAALAAAMAAQQQ